MTSGKLSEWSGKWRRGRVLFFFWGGLVGLGCVWFPFLFRAVFGFSVVFDTTPTDRLQNTT